MEVRTCSKCKRLFNYLSGASICPGCKAKLEEKFQEVSAENGSNDIRVGYDYGGVFSGFVRSGRVYSGQEILFLRAEGES